jgi:hypothetical protein
MVVPDGWFDYPAAVNAGRRAVAAWLAAQQRRWPRVRLTVAHCPEGGGHCLPVGLAELELRWCHPDSVRDGRFFDGSLKDRAEGEADESETAAEERHQLDCRSTLWSPVRFPRRAFFLPANGRAVVLRAG